MMRNLKYRMMVFMSRRMLACDEASFLISYRQDQRLGLKQWWQLRMHLLTCHLCRKYARQIVQMTRTLEQYRESCHPDSCTHHLSEEASARIQRSLQGEMDTE